MEPRCGSARVTTPRGHTHALTLTSLELLPDPAKVAILGLLTASCWGIVFGLGGTMTAWPHLFYLPILLGAVLFGRGGGLVVGLSAAVVCGPLMPLDTAAQVAQTTDGWLLRGVFFLGVGSLAGAVIGSL